jgi:hypothetical protein
MNILENVIAMFAIVFVLALVASPSVWLAHRRGRSKVIWGAIGTLTPFLSILVLALIGDCDEKKAAKLNVAAPISN